MRSGTRGLEIHRVKNSFQYHWAFGAEKQVTENGPPTPIFTLPGKPLVPQLKSRCDIISSSVSQTNLHKSNGVLALSLLRLPLLLRRAQNPQRPPPTRRPPRPNLSISLRRRSKTLHDHTGPSALRAGTQGIIHIDRRPCVPRILQAAGGV